jgi:hypothetical protein
MHEIVEAHVQNLLKPTQAALRGGVADGLHGSLADILAVKVHSNAEFDDITAQIIHLLS